MIEDASRSRTSKEVNDKNSLELIIWNFLTNAKVQKSFKII